MYTIGLPYIIYSTCILLDYLTLFIHINYKTDCLVLLFLYFINLKYMNKIKNLVRYNFFVFSVAENSRGDF